MRIAIIADDLTSAADVGVQFARRGYATTVRPLHGPLSPEHADVVAVNTDSRAQSPTEAERRTRRAARQFSPFRHIIYKAVDSTLRGHLAVEVSALLDETGTRTAIFAPAFPPCGRITRNGIQLISGRPIHETAFACDPTHPVHSSDIKTVLRSSGLEPITTIKPDDIHHPDFWTRSIVTSRCVVADAETQQDLDVLVASIPDWRSVCWVGSPGLARALADALPPTEQQSLSATQCRKILVVSGSLNPVTQGQVRKLVSRMGAIAIPVGAPANDECAVSTSALGALRQHLREKRIVILSSVALTELEETREITRPSNAVKILAEMAAVAVNDGLVDTLILTGGTTALAVLERSGINQLKLLNELAPGIPMARGVAGRHELTVVTKAGGFGSDEGLSDLCRDLLAGPVGSGRI